MTSDPVSTYAQLLERRRASIGEFERRHRLFGYAKLATAAAAVGLVWLALARNAAAILWVLVPAAVFAVLVVLHDKTLRAMERLRRAAAFFEAGLARLEGKWPGTGENGERYQEPEHPFAQDLDLFGNG